MKLSDASSSPAPGRWRSTTPAIRYEERIVDNACMQLVRRPQAFDVLLLENLYGDIVSDLCAGLVGGLGIVPGANLGVRTAIFEAVHGTAPDIAGKNLANPLAASSRASLLLRHVGPAPRADAIDRAVSRLLARGAPDARSRRQATTSAVRGRLIASCRAIGLSVDAP